MDAATLILITGSYAASMITNKVAEKAIEVAYDRLVASIKARLGREPRLEDYKSGVINKILPEDREVLQQVQEIFALSPVLRRAEMVAPVLQGARVLWVDDNPDNNLYERMTLDSLGVTIDLAFSTGEALSMLSRTKYDVVISDMERNGVTDEGLRLLRQMQERRSYLKTVLYTFNLKPETGIPQGAFGITERPDELLHYILDILERERV